MPTIAELRERQPKFDEYEYTDEDIVRYMNSQIDETLEETALRYGYDMPTSDTGKAFNIGTSGWKEGMAHVGNALGMDNDAYIREQQARQQLLGQTSGAPQSWDEVDGLGEGFDYAWTKAVESSPYMAEYAVGALTGGASLGPTLAKGGLRASMAAGPRTAAQITKDAAMINKARQTGATVGGISASYPSALGDVLGNQYDQSGGEYDLLAAAGYAAPYAAANAVGIEGLVTRAGTTGLKTGLTGSRAANAGIMGTTTALSESGSETFQELMNQQARAGMDATYDPFGEEAQAAYKESAIAGGLIGFAPGAVGGAAQRRRANPVDQDRQADLLNPSTGLEITQPRDLGYTEDYQYGYNENPYGETPYSVPEVTPPVEINPQGIDQSLSTVDESDKEVLDANVANADTAAAPAFEPLDADEEGKPRRYAVQDADGNVGIATVTRKTGGDGHVSFTFGEGVKKPRASWKPTEKSPGTYTRMDDDATILGGAYGLTAVPKTTKANTEANAAAPTADIESGIDLYNDQTDEQIKAQQEKDDKDLGMEVDKLDGPLLAAVKSTKQKTKGKVTLTAGEIKGIVRKLLSPTDIKPVVYNDKGIGINVEQTRAKGEKVQAIYDAFMDVAAKAQAYASQQSNAVNSDMIKESDSTTAATGDVNELAASNAESKAAKAATKSGDKISATRSELDAAIQNLIAAAGGASNVDAIISANKTKIQKKGSWVLNAKRYAPLARKLKKNNANMKDVERALDVLISGTWNRYKQGDLSVENENDIVRGSESRKSYESAKREGSDKLADVAENKGAASYPNPAPKMKRQVVGTKKVKDKATGKEVTVDIVETEEQLKERKRDATKDWKARHEKGVHGVLNHLRQTGTAMEQALATAIQKSMKRSGSTPELRWTKEGENPNYDPATNTIAIDQNASPEQILHETLHGALQWFVYASPSHPAVKRLGKSLDSLLEFYHDKEKFGKVKLSESELSEVASVMNVIESLMGRGTTEGKLDAILELVSYGNTLRSFKKVLKSAESNRKSSPANAVWYKRLGQIFREIIKLTQRLLGVSNTLANDVLNDSLELLLDFKARETAASKKTKLTPSKLESAVRSDAAALSNKFFRDRFLPKWFSTQFLFDAAHWDKGVDFLKSKGSKLKNLIQKEMPGFAGRISKWAPRFNVSELIDKLMDNYKVARHAGYQIAEQLADMIQHGTKEQQQAIVDYLDGDKTALDGQQEGFKLKAQGLANTVKDYVNLYTQSLSPEDQAFFENVKFSEKLFFVSRTKNVASRTFGQRKMRDIIGSQAHTEEDLSGFEDLMKRPGEADIDVDNGRFYKVYETKNNAKPTVAGFIIKEKADEFINNGLVPEGLEIRKQEGEWRIKKKVKDGYSFTTNMTAREAIEANKSKDLAFAIKNTFAALGGYYASKNFSSELSTVGYDSNGKPSEATVVYEDIEAAIETRDLSEDQITVFKASDEETKNSEILNKFRNYNVWVEIPKVDAYGPLAGKVIHGPVWAAMNDMSDRKGFINMRGYSDTLRWFKKSKTVYNPGTHITNVGTNITLAIMHDLSIGTLHQASKLFSKYGVASNSLTKDEIAMMEAFMKSGALLGNFSSAEVKKEITKALADQVKTGDGFLSKRIKSFLDYEKGKSEGISKLIDAAKRKGLKGAELAEYTDKIATEVYAAEDNIFRLAAFITTMKETNGDMEKSGRFARTAFLDYDIDSVYVRLLRESAIPFVSWTYAIMPVLGRIAMTQPWKVANVLTAYAVLGNMFAAMAGDDDDELRKNGPEYLRENLFGMDFLPYSYVRIPFMGDSENPVYFKLGDYIPLHSTMRGTPAGFLGQDWMPSGFTPNNPYLSAAIFAVVGVDPYTGKSIHEETDTSAEKFVNVSKKMYDIAAPTLVSSRNLEKTAQIARGDTTMSGKTMSHYAILRAMGLKLYDHNVDDQAVTNNIIAKKIRSDYKKAINKAIREAARSGSPDYEVLDREIQDFYSRMQEDLDELYGVEQD